MAPSDKGTFILTIWRQPSLLFNNNTCYNEWINDWLDVNAFLESTLSSKKEKNLSYLLAAY